MSSEAEEATGNPYRASDLPLAETAVGLSDPEKAELLTRYRSAIFALGVFFVLMGVMVGVFAAVVWTADAAAMGLTPEEQQEVALTAAFFAALRITIGLLECRYWVAPVLLGIVVSGVAIYNAVFSSNYGALSLAILETAQAARVLTFAWQLQRGRVPLRDDPAIYGPTTTELEDSLDDDDEEDDDLDWGVSEEEEERLRREAEEAESRRDADAAKDERGRAARRSEES